ncbi:MAG TPA: YggT family protein [Chromatiales bacterium]|nr:YggT family protein [Chromatiales bacterium]
MSSSYLTNPAVFLIQTLFGLYILVVVLRFLLQLFRADFYNPVSQFIVKATTPVLRPLRRIIPGLAGLDLASIVLAWLLQAVALLLVGMVLGLGFRPLGALLWAIPALTELVINIFLYGILIQVILSWIAPASHNPAISLLYTLTEPILRPARRLLPPISGLDLSPMLVLIGLMLLKMLLLPPLRLITGSPF